MKSFKNLIAAAVAAVVCVFAFEASAQRGFDEFAGATTVQILPAQLTGSASIVSNKAVDLHVFTGIAKIDVSIVTNGTGSTSLYMYGSMDQTNWTPLANYALGTNYTVNITNLMYGGSNLVGTNVLTLAYVPTTGSATNGFMNTYPTFPSQSYFTNSFASGPLNISKTGVYTIGLAVDDAPRYLELAVSNGASGATNGVSATMTTQIANQYHVVP